MFPPQWHTHCCIAERSSKHRRHLGLLPGSCSSKSCPWSGMGGGVGDGGQFSLRLASQSHCIILLGVLGLLFSKWCVPLTSCCTAAFIVYNISHGLTESVSLSLSLSLFICQPQLLLHLELSASKRMSSVRTEPWESCALVPPCWNSLQCSGIVLLPCQKVLWQTYPTHEMAAVDFL